jgi:tetratricopeptide (TPR) repeat protein
VTELKTTTNNSWSAPQAFALAVFALLLGVCGGWLIRRSVAASPADKNTVAATTPTSMPTAPVNPAFSSVPAGPSAADLKQAADSQAAPLLEKLKTDPKNPALLTQVGNLYYDAKQYPAAIDYYERSLKLQPMDTSVGTDLGTAYWYSGDADTAIKQFHKVLNLAPTKADTLFNLGIVEWQGKKDSKAAVAAWQKLLETNPNFDNKNGVLQLIAQAQNQ